MDDYAYLCSLGRMMRNPMPVVRSKQMEEKELKRDKALDVASTVYEAYRLKWLQTYGSDAVHKDAAPEWQFFKDELYKLPGGVIKKERTYGQIGSDGQWSLQMWVAEYPCPTSFLEAELSDSEMSEIFRTRKDMY